MHVRMSVSVLGHVSCCSELPAAAAGSVLPFAALTNAHTPPTLSVQCHIAVAGASAQRERALCTLHWAPIVRALTVFVTPAPPRSQCCSKVPPAATASLGQGREASQRPPSLFPLPLPHTPAFLPMACSPGPLFGTPKRLTQRPHPPFIIR